MKRLLILIIVPVMLLVFASLGWGGGIGTPCPADVYCKEMGYELKIVTEKDGGQHSICIFPDGTSCETWSFLKGSCGEEHSYCAKKGYRLKVKKDGKNAFSPHYAVCVGEDGEEKGSVTDLMKLERKFNRRNDELLPRPLSAEAAGSYVQANGPPPAAFDWRTDLGFNWMTAVKNQGSCGSCWAFSALGVVEAVYNIYHANPDLDIDLSEEFLVSNCNPLATYGCCGGWHEDALKSVMDHGVPDEACLPYVSGVCDCFPNPPCPSPLPPTNSPCVNSSATSCSATFCTNACPDVENRRIKIKSYNYIPGTQNDIKQAVVDHGPVSVVMALSGVWDANGIYRCSTSTCWDRDGDQSCDLAGTCVIPAGQPTGNCSGGGWACETDADCDEDTNGDGQCTQADCPINHAVIITGYNDAGRYWIVKNSHGTGFGFNPPVDKGYFNVGYGECRIEAAPLWAEAAVIDPPMKGDFDLIVESITTDPVTPVAGQRVDVTVIVKNQGVNSIANPFRIEFYKHRETAPPIGTVGDFYCLPDSLGAGTRYYCKGTALYRQAGTYKMWAYADVLEVASFGQVEETNESNNIFGSQAITVLEAPDLIVQSITTNPASPYIGPVSVKVTVRNQGTGDAVGPFSIDFYQDRQGLPPTNMRGDLSCSKDRLSAEASTECSGTVSYLSPGTYKMWAQVDTYNRVPESREMNNVLGPQKIVVIAKGVLSVQPADTFYSSGRQGGSFTPSSKKYTLKNTGGSDITWTANAFTGSLGWSWITLSLAGGTLAPKASTDVTVSINSNANSLTPDIYTGTVNFTNTTNHEGDTTRTVQLTVNEPLIRPDLVETSVSNPPEAARPASGFDVTDTTLNQGAYDAAESGTRYYLSPRTTIGQGGEVVIGSRQVGALKAGDSDTGTAQVFIPAATKHGTYYLLACANKVSPTIAETNRNNNCIASSTTVQVTLPDYAETSVNALQTTARLGTSFKVEDTVTNQGVVASTEVSTTRYYLSPDPLKTKGGLKKLLKGGRKVDPLGPGGTSIGKETEVYVPTTIPLGSYHVMACADDTNVIAETVEKNNCRISTGTIKITK